MIAFMILFFPAVIATRIFETVKKTDLSRKQWLCRYCTNALLINLFCFLVKALVLRTAAAPLYTLFADVTPSAAANYLIMAIPAAVALGFTQVFMSETVKVEVEEAEDGQ